MDAYIFIPARYHSSRFPGKPLALISGKAMILHVVERSLKSKLAKGVFVATDDKRIFNQVLQTKAIPVMTSEDCPSGTDRVYEAIKELSKHGYEFKDEDVIINVQGDEPLVASRLIDELIEVMQKDRPDIATPACLITSKKVFYDSNVVKVVFDSSEHALYFSRSPIPFVRDAEINNSQDILSYPAYQHIGLYAYTVKSLKDFTSLKQSRLEQLEKLEQLRALEHGKRIKILLTTYQSKGVDVLDDIKEVQRCLSISS